MKPCDETLRCNSALFEVPQDLGLRYGHCADRLSDQRFIQVMANDHQAGLAGFVGLPRSIVKMLQSLADTMDNQAHWLVGDCNKAFDSVNFLIFNQILQGFSQSLRIKT